MVVEAMMAVPVSRTGISKVGLMGGLLGFLPPFAFGVIRIFHPPEGHSIAEGSALLLGISVVYLPAIWASLAATSARAWVLLSVGILSLLMAFVGSAGSGIGLVLLPATVLLIVGRLKTTTGYEGTKN
ncbi:MAG: hypothetical protein ACE5IZ_09915 [Dehalococcoidia bacterium]